MPVPFPTLDPDTGTLVPTDYYTVGEVADLLHVSHSTVRRRIKAGDWSFFSPMTGAYFFSPAHVAEVMERQTHHAPELSECDATPPPPKLGTPLTDTDLEGIR